MRVYAEESLPSEKKGLYFSTNQTQTNQHINEYTIHSYGVTNQGLNYFSSILKKLNKWLKDPKQQVYVEYTNPIRDYVKHTGHSSEIMGIAI